MEYWDKRAINYIHALAVDQGILASEQIGRISRAGNQYAANVLRFSDGALDLLLPIQNIAILRNWAEVRGPDIYLTRLALDNRLLSLSPNTEDYDRDSEVYSIIETQAAHLLALLNA